MSNITEWARLHDLQACVICGKYFVRRSEQICSRDCLDKAMANQSDGQQSNADLNASKQNNFGGVVK